MHARLLLPIALLCVAAAGASSGHGAGSPADQIAVATTDGRIVLVSPGGKRLAVLTSNRRPLTSSWAPDWSPDGSRIAFARTSDGRRSFHIYVMNADGSGLHQISHGRFDEDPAWSPDGRWIAYASETGIRLIHPDGSGMRRVKATGIETPRYTRPFASTPSRTPDGRLSYAFHPEWPGDWPVSCKRSGSHCGWVMTVRPDGTDPRPLVRGRDAHWSPDGGTVVFTPPNGGVATVAAVGGEPHFLGRGYLANWSLDGTQIIYARLGLGTAGDAIWLMHADGGGQHRILHVASMPAWRPLPQP
jgi:Tol biopolymer transport system component